MLPLDSSGRATREPHFLWSGVLLVALVLLAFGRTLQNGFAFDDFPFLVDNPFVRAPQRLADVFLDARTHTAAGHALTYRPLRTLLFAAEFRLFGERAELYHAVNLVLHAGVVLVVWRLARRLLTARFALLVAATLACHPLLSEVVASIKAQDDLVAALAITSAVLCFDRTTRDDPTNPRRWLVLVPFLIGMFAKEHAVVLPVPLAVWSWIVLERRKPDFALLGALVALAGGFLALRSHALPETGGVDPLQGQWLFPGAFAAIPLYAKLFVWPHPLSIDHASVHALPLDSWILWLSVVAQVGVGVGIWRLRNRGVRVGWGWFYVLLLPSLNPLGTVVVFAERFAYLPLVGLAFAVAAGVQGKLESHPARRIVLVALVPLALFTTLSFVRCGDWKNTESLLRAALEVDPDSVMARTALRREFVAQGRVVEATALLPGSETLRPPTSFGERAALADRGVLAAQQGKFEEALRCYAPIVSTSFAQWDDWLNYGTCLVNTGESAGAKRAFEKALELRPGAPSVLRMLGRMELDAERWPSALAHLRDAVQREPEHVTGWYFCVYAGWKAEGDEVALARLAEATTRGIALGPLIKSDWLRWESSAGPLRAELRRIGGLDGQ